MLWSQMGLIIKVILGSGLLESADSLDRGALALITNGLVAAEHPEAQREAQRYGGDFKKDDRPETGGGDGAG